MPPVDRGGVADHVVRAVLAVGDPVAAPGAKGGLFLIG